MVLPPRVHFSFLFFEGKMCPLSRRAPGLFVKGEGIPAFVAGAGLIFERERRALFGRALLSVRRFTSEVSAAQCVGCAVRLLLWRCVCCCVGAPSVRLFRIFCPRFHFVFLRPRLHHTRVPMCLHFVFIRPHLLRTSPARAQPPCTAAKMAAAMAAKPMR